MKKRIISAHYKAYLEEAKSLAPFFSRKSWSSEYEHDPGLTQLEILANALALVQEHYDAILASGISLYKKASVERWTASPPTPNVFTFHADFSGPCRDDFKAVPVGKGELCRAVEHIPGLFRTWIFDRPDGHKKYPELAIEFAPVLPVEQASFSVSVENGQTEQALREKRRVLEAAQASLRQWKNLCHPTLGVREIKFAPLELEISIELSPDADTQVRLSAFIAELMLATNEYLRPRTAPLGSIRPSSILRYLSLFYSKQGDAESNRPYRLLALELQKPNEHDPSANKFFHLENGYDAFFITSWNIKLFSGKSLFPLDRQTLEHARYIADRSLTKKLRDEQWGIEKTEGQDPVRNNIRDSAVFDMDFPHLQDQFPESYLALGGDYRDNPLRKAEVRQFQGWLFLFEQLLADALTPLQNPSLLFAPKPLEAEYFCADTQNPLLGVLTSVNSYREKLLELVKGSTEFSVRRKALLLYLAALQGEEPWFRPEDVDTGNSDDIEKELATLASWLRLLPWLNGRRLLDSQADAWGLGDIGWEGVLEQRLSFLLPPFTPMSTNPIQHYFEIRQFSNPLTGQPEYRCYIRDKDKNLRIISNMVSASLDDAELSGLIAMRLAGRKEHYRLVGNEIHIGLMAKLVASNNYTLSGNQPDANKRINDTVAWARSILPHWIRVIKYENIDKRRPFELAVLFEEETIPLPERIKLSKAIKGHIPAHLYAHVFFLGKEERAWVNEVLLKRNRSGSQALDEDSVYHHELLRLLHSLEKMQQVTMQEVKTETSEELISVNTNSDVATDAS